MGRGKKKTDKKKDEASKEVEEPMRSLSISEQQPSTSREESVTVSSRESTAPPSDDGGLTGGARRKKDQAKSDADDVPIVVPTPPKPEETIKEEDDGGLGLGLGGAKKKRSRKKKETAVEAAAAATEASQPATAAVATATIPSPSPVSIAPAQAWGQRSGQSTKPETREAAPGVGPLQPSPGYGPAQPAPGFIPTPMSGYGPPQTTPGFESSQPVPVTEPPPGFRASQPTPGYGRGRAMQQSGMPGPQASGPGQSQPTAVFVTPQAPSGRGRGRPTTMQQAMRHETISAPKSEVALSRFQIPHKIIGNSVRFRPVKVLTNYLPMKIKAMDIYRYDVSFKPDKPKKMIPRAFILAKGKLFPKFTLAFDQMKNCYSTQPLPKVTNTERVTTNVEIIDNNGRALTFEVSFKATGIVQLGSLLKYMTENTSTSLNPPTEAIQCVDVILRQGTLENYIKAGRQFFKRPSRPIDLGDGLEMWTGLFQSAIFTSMPFINIDVAHKGFPKQQKLVDAIKNDFRLDLNKPLDQQQGRGLENFSMFIKGLRVMASIGGDNSASGKKREYICNEMVRPPNVMKFKMTDAAGNTKDISVADYFLKEKCIRLQYPNLNCMWVGPRDKNIYYPMELLEVSYGQALNKQLNEMQLSKMVREAATPPDDRKKKIEEVIRDMRYSQNPHFKHFGLEISDQFFPVDAKVLTPPRLEVGGSQATVEPRKGQWRADKLLRPEALDSWGFVALDADADKSNAEYIIKMMMDVGYQMGMSINAPGFRAFNLRINDLTRCFSAAVQKNIKFLVIIVSTRGRDYYHRVKKVAEREVGILTQCIKDVTAQRRMNDQTIRNILLKVNSKLMGINQALDGRSVPKCLAGGGVMVVGADVTHPSPEQMSVPSIAAVTASIDTQCFMYNIQLSIQTPKKEMIVEFEDMMVEHLRVYRDRQKALPKKIFVFRDGVSEGQFAQVMHSELQAVHSAYARLAGPQAKLEVLFLLVQKRHHTRMFLGPTNSQNVEPGTVVDTHIVHPKELDFYLVSHQAIKGTARPTRYHAVCNDGNIPHDEVEQLTFYLCHLYSRCTRSVSYPTPTYYAHLACLRARSLTHGESFNNADLERHPRRLQVMDKILQISRMFFV